MSFCSFADIAGSFITAFTCAQMDTWISG